MKEMRKRFGIGLTFGVVALAAVIALAAGEAKNFKTSLHSSNAGMKFWYEAPDGFKSVSGISYEDAKCNTCHPDNCKACHEKGMKKGDVSDPNICFKCHLKQQATLQMDQAAGTPDVHFANGKVCVDCHKNDKIDDVHGDGTEYQSMRQPGAVKSTCTDCHQPSQDIDAHKKHKDKLACTACHTSNVLGCVNCHFDSFIATGTKEGNFIPTNNWVILMNYNNQVVSANAITLVSKGKTFVAYSPFFSHSMKKEAKKCEDCHGNAAMAKIKAGEKIPMIKMEGDKIVSWNGVVPCVPESLEWQFFNKEGDKWVPIADAPAPKVQMVGYGTPLNEKQIKMLQAPFKSK
jgi:hypothetical protein